MILRTRRLREGAAPLSASGRGAYVRAVGKVVAVSVTVSELITVVLMKALVGDFVAQGMLIALVCSAPISAWVADREYRMRRLIANQRDQLSTLNLELNARNADLDAFARAVAHDLKNPLAAIIGFADSLRSDSRFSARDEATAALTSIADAGGRAAEIIDGLLLLHGVRSETGVLTEVDSGAAVDAALETVAHDIVEHQATVTRSGTFPRVQAHGAWLVQVWINLIANAIKYGGSPPAVGLAAHADSEGMVRFEVSDNGRGIAPDDRARVFREFQRVGTTDIDGHGLGLAIVDRVVKRLGGAVGVDGAAGGGSVFWFTVPSAEIG